MNVNMLKSAGKVFVTVECIAGYAFSKTETREKSALLPILCSHFGLLQDDSAHLDAFECLLPQSGFAV